MRMVKEYCGSAWKTSKRFDGGRKEELKQIKDCLSLLDTFHDNLEKKTDVLISM